MQRSVSSNSLLQDFTSTLSTASTVTKLRMIASVPFLLTAYVFFVIGTAIAGATDRTD